MASKSKRVPVAAAKRVAHEQDLDQVIIVGFRKSDGHTHVVTYGKTLVDCDQAAFGGNRIKREVLRWPPELCDDKPRRRR